MAKYALVDSGEVKTIIIADASFVSNKGDSAKSDLGFPSGTWKLITSAEIGWKFLGGMFLSGLGDRSLIAPEKLVLTVVAETDEVSPAWTYQWKKGGENINEATSPTYTIDPSTAGDDDGSYTCAVSDGTNSVESEAATVVVEVAE